MRYTNKKSAQNNGASALTVSELASGPLTHIIVVDTDATAGTATIEVMPEGRTDYETLYDSTGTAAAVVDLTDVKTLSVSDYPMNAARVTPTGFTGSYLKATVISA